VLEEISSTPSESLSARGSSTMNAMPVVLATAATAIPLGALAWWLPPLQQDRGIPLTRRAAGWIAAAAALIALAMALAGIAAPIAVAAGLLVNLAAITVLTDLRAFKIPADTCWWTAGLGAGTFAWWLFSTPGPIAWAPIVPAAILSAMLITVAFATWWFGLTGMGDVRLLIALAATTAWWLNFETLLPALLAMLAVTVAVTVFRRHSGSGLKVKVPAGPVYVTLYLVAAALTLASAIA